MIQSPRNSPLFGAIKAAAAAVAQGRSPVLAPRPAAPEPSSSDDSSFESFCLDDGPAEEPQESLEAVMEDLKQQMSSLSETSQVVRSQMKSICRRTKEESIEWMNAPMKPKTVAARLWLAAHGLPAEPSLDSFFDACLAAASTADFESRVLTFSKEDAVALWKGEQRITVFDILAQLPELFE
jgi:hypothetical protein